MLDPADKLLEVLRGRIEPRSSLVSEPVFTTSGCRRLDPLLVLEISTGEVMGDSGRADRQPRRVFTTSDQIEDQAEADDGDTEHFQHGTKIPASLPVDESPGEQYHHVDHAADVDQDPVSARPCHTPQLAEDSLIIEWDQQLDVEPQWPDSGDGWLFRLRRQGQRVGNLSHTERLPDHPSGSDPGQNTCAVEHLEFRSEFDRTTVGSLEHMQSAASAKPLQEGTATGNVPARRMIQKDAAQAGGGC